MSHPPAAAHPMPSPALRADLQLASSAPDIPTADHIDQWLNQLAALLPDLNGEVAVRIVDEAEMRELNHQYRGKDYATNVLSFPVDLDDFAGLPLEEAFELPPLGDLVICAPVIAREAVEQHKTSDAHWAHMLVHGLLHLIGYDHQHDQEAEIMESLETRLLTQLGYPPPYEATESL